MAVNPMQRKANNSFLLGIVVTLIITGIIIAVLLMQLSKLNNEQKQLEAQKTHAYVLQTAVKSGQIIEDSNFKQIEVNKNAIPSNAITSSADLTNYAMCDSEGRTIITQEDGSYVLVISDTNKPTLYFDEETERYYYQDQGQKVFVTLDSQMVIAKIDLEANTLLTSSLVTRGGLINSDVRRQEYNVITLQSQLETGEYIDVRLRLPNGQDYIVLSHKLITIPEIDGIPSENCIWLELDELEILNMSCAIVEAYKMDGSMLYATKYVEPGNQKAASTTYLPSDGVIALMNKDPNCLNEAKNALFIRNNDSSEKGVIRNPINSATNTEDAADKVQQGVSSEIQGLQEEREKYLESLGM